MSGRQTGLALGGLIVFTTFAVALQRSVHLSGGNSKANSHVLSLRTCLGVSRFMFYLLKQALPKIEPL